MKTRYRMIVRRKIEVTRRLRLRSGARAQPHLDDPMEMPSEVIDLATDEGHPPGTPANSKQGTSDS